MASRSLAGFCRRNWTLAFRGSSGAWRLLGYLGIAISIVVDLTSGSIHVVADQRRLTPLGRRQSDKTELTQRDYHKQNVTRLAPQTGGLLRRVLELPRSLVR